MADKPKTATYRKLGDQYQIDVPGQPTGFTPDVKSLYDQLNHLQRLGFTLVEDKDHPLHLDDKVN